MGSSTPLLVFLIFCGMDHAAAVFYKRLGFLVSLQKGLSYRSMMSWLYAAGYALL